MGAQIDEKAMGQCTHVLIFLPIKCVEPLKHVLTTELARVSGGPTSKQTNKQTIESHTLSNSIINKQIPM